MGLSINKNLGERTGVLTEIFYLLLLRNKTSARMLRHKIVCILLLLYNKRLFQKRKL